uniref:ubiquitinyl hydrolase 1 n=1 Tax=Plectus sambesii TaxID=2011161 RepID=A0A914VS44_9BILA
MSCLQDFTTPEQLEDGEMVHCKHCKANTPASKKLDIWRLPKILLVHLKRFVYVEKDRRWVKSLKLIDFPLHNFDPSEFIVNSEDKHLKYNCFAMANHYGAMGA